MKHINTKIADIHYDKEKIEPSTSAFASPIVLVQKKDGTWRFAMDYRKINSANS
jgi:hypothetical protein